MRSLRRIAFALVLATATSVTLLVLHPAAATPGDLDRSFGTTGTVETPIGSASVAYGLALLPDGRIVVSGSSGNMLALARYQPDGRLDAGFGSGGIVTGTAFFQRGLALQPDGKILVGASSGVQQMVLARYRGDGTLDTDFGSGGFATGPPGGTRDLAVQPDGKIVVVGTAGGAWALQVARFGPDGTLDAGFGTNGAAQTPIGYAAVADTVALQPDGKIVVAGSSTPGDPRPPPPPPPAPPPPPPPTPPPEGMILARYHPDGSLDQSFGSGGVISVRIGRRSSVAELGLQPDGRILAAGGSDGRTALLRYNSEGLLDAGFGSSGVVLGPPDSAGFPSAALALQLDGRILVGGRNFLARYRRDGKPDPTFGSRGSVTTGDGSVGTINALAVQKDGRILGAGVDQARRPSHFRLSRFSASLPTTISARPKAIRFGTPTVVQGTLTAPRAGAVVKILERDCHHFSTRVVKLTTTDSQGRWAARVRPGSRAAIRAEVDGELSGPLAVQVRPKLTLERLAGKRFRARAVGGHSLDGSVVVLQQFSRARWVDRRRIFLRRIARRGSSVVSGRTFSAPKTLGRRLRLFLPTTGRNTCYAAAASRAMNG